MANGLEMLDSLLRSNKLPQWIKDKAPWTTYCAVCKHSFHATTSARSVQMVQRHLAGGKHWYCVEQRKLEFSADISKGVLQVNA